MRGAVPSTRFTDNRRRPLGRHPTSTPRASPEALPGMEHYSCLHWVLSTLPAFAGPGRGRADNSGQALSHILQPPRREQDRAHQVQIPFD